MVELSAGATAVLTSYDAGSLTEDALGSELAKLPEGEMTDALATLYARMRGVAPEKVARELHERLLEAEIEGILEDMVESGELVRAESEEARRSPDPSVLRDDPAAEEAWARFAEVFEAAREGVRRSLLPRPWPRLRRMLRGAEFAGSRGVDYSTVWKWRQDGRLPEALGGGAIGTPVFIPDDAAIVDRDLADGHPPGLALALHWYRHAPSDAAQGHAISAVLLDLPEGWARTFLATVAGWEEEAMARRAEAPSEEERRRAELVPPLANLRELRRERGLTQAALAEGIGRAQTGVASMEKRAAEGSGARRGTAEDLSRVLGVCPEDLWEPRRRTPREYLSARAFAARKGVAYKTAQRWLRDGRLPEAARKRPVSHRLIPEDATVIDADLARDHPAAVALALHRHRHAAPGPDGDAERAWLVEHAREDMPDDEAWDFFGTLRRWETEGDPGPPPEPPPVPSPDPASRSPVPPLANLRTFRRAAGMTLAELAEKSGVSPSEVRRLDAAGTFGNPRDKVGYAKRDSEAGGEVRNPRRGTAEKLAAALSVAPEALWDPSAELPVARLSTTDFADSRGVSVATVRGWLRDGRLPEAGAGDAKPGKHRLIPEDATVVDRDLAESNPGMAALFLHRRRHGLYASDDEFRGDLASLAPERRDEILSTLANEDPGVSRGVVAVEHRRERSREGRA